MPPTQERKCSTWLYLENEHSKVPHSLRTQNEMYRVAGNSRNKRRKYNKHPHITRKEPAHKPTEANPRQ